MVAAAIKFNSPSRQPPGRRLLSLLRRNTVHNFSLDHDRPRSRGGRYSLPNLVCCCRRCNEVKGQLTGEEFRALIRLLRAWEPKGARSVLSRLRSSGKIMRRV